MGGKGEKGKKSYILHLCAHLYLVFKKNIGNYSTKFYGHGFTANISL